MKKANELRMEVENRLRELERLSEEARSGVLREWLRMVGRFHRYSIYNTWLILLQRPGATLVAGYRTWQKLGRQVRRGEKGIAILIPRRYKVEVIDPETGEVREEEKVYFTTGYVFDVSQTEGKPLPPPPGGLPDGDGGEELARRLEELAARRGIAVEEKEQLFSPDGRPAVGQSLGGRIRLRAGLSPLARAAVLAHEIAHELLHRQHAVSREEAEVEAEAVAYAVLAHFGFEHHGAGSYVGWWDRDGRILRSRMERIAATVREILRELLGEEGDGESPEDLE